jgi:hypothetical protein
MQVATLMSVLMKAGGDKATSVVMYDNFPDVGMERWMELVHQPLRNNRLIAPNQQDTRWVVTPAGERFIAANGEQSPLPSNEEERK